jgi:hypothetical protein
MQMHLGDTANGDIGPRAMYVSMRAPNGRLEGGQEASKGPTKGREAPRRARAQ